MKKLLSLLTLSGISLCLVAQVAGPQNGTIFSNTTKSGSSRAWINAANAGASDNVYATFGNLSSSMGSYTDYLTATGFGFNIPANYTITGIKVTIERADVNLSTADYSIRIVKGGVMGTTDRSSGAAYSVSSSFAIKDTYQDYGGESDLWNESWTATAINNSGFGVAVAAQRSQTGTGTIGRIDNIRIAVYYNVISTLPVKLINFSAQAKTEIVRLSWTTAEESDMDRFEVQRSANGTEFSSFGTIICTNQRTVTAYAFNDYAPLQGISYYRLKILEKDGKTSYSKIVTVQQNIENATTLYPSPWKKGSALNIRNAGNEKLSIQFYNYTGELVTKLTTSSGQVPVDILSNTRGILRYKVYNEKKEVTGSGTLMVY